MEEISKHILKISKAIRNPDLSISKRLAEIVLEVFVIVFAVSLSQFLERQREQNVKQKEVKEFLLGLKNDMIANENQAKKDIQVFNDFKITYLYLSHLNADKKPDNDSLRAAVEQIGDNVSFRPGVSRFEGFKSAGKLEEITDKRLLQDILFYYEQAAPELNTSVTGWGILQERLAEFFMNNKIEYKDGTNNYFQLINTPKVKNLSKILVPWPQLYERYNQIVTLSATIAKEIDNDYTKINK